MRLSQSLMICGATLAGTFVALSYAEQSSFKKNLYIALSFGGLSLVAIGYYSASMGL